MQIVTGFTGTEHVTAAMDGAANAGICGDGQYVLMVGSMLKATVMTSNSVRIADGDVMINGRHGFIAKGSYEDLTIESGTTGYNRNDLVVARYTINASTKVESIALVVIKGTQTTGTAADPTYNAGSILSGDTTVDMPLWRIPLTGITPGTPVAMYSLSPSLATLQDSISQYIGTKSESNGSCVLDNGLIINFGKIETINMTSYQAGGGYIAEAEFKNSYKSFCVCVCGALYGAGIPRVGTTGWTNTAINLLCDAQLSGAYISWLAIGV